MPGSEGSGGGVALVPGRECGACTACCVDLAIVDDGMRKLPGIPCDHCTSEGGCAIYALRPQVCRSYHCFWRELDMLDESWRPDRSGILVQWASKQPSGDAGHAVDLILLGAPDRLATDDFAGLAGGFIDSGTATYLNLSNGPDFFPTRAFLNRALAPAVTARDYAQIKRVIWQVYLEAKDFPAVPATIEQYRAL